MLELFFSSGEQDQDRAVVEHEYFSRQKGGNLKKFYDAEMEYLEDKSVEILWDISGYMYFFAKKAKNGQKGQGERNIHCVLWNE